MGRRRGPGSVALALVIAAGAGCKDEQGAAPKPGEVSLERRCEQLGQRCADPAKVDKLVEQCKQAAAQQTAKGCAYQARAAYECYQQRLCGKGDKVWAVDDFRVLADRHQACTAERDALRDCLAK